MELLLPFTYSTPEPPTAFLIFKGSVIRLSKACFCYVKHDNYKQISSLLITSVHSTAFLPPLLSVQQGFPKLQQSVATEASLDPEEMFFFLFTFETQMWGFLQLFSTSPPVLWNLSSLSPSCLIPPLGTSPNEPSQVRSDTVFASPSKTTVRLNIQW